MVVEDGELNVDEIQQIQPEQFGKLHNEAVLGLLKHPDYNPNSGVQDNMVLMLQVMSEKYPKFFDKNLNINQFGKELYGDYNKNYLNYHSLIEIFENKEKDINKNIMNYVENSISSEKDSKSNLLDKKQLIAFNSVKKASLVLWTVEAPNNLVMEKNYLNKSSCDATQQVIIADAAASLIFWWNPPASIIAGAASSLLVRQDQIQNYGGGCATN